MRITVTVGRQLGSGGSEVGRRIADVLGIRCIDREIVSRTAQQMEMDEDDLAAREERGANFWERLLRGLSVGPPEVPYLPPPIPTISDRELFDAESHVMKDIAAKEDCVIVGRGASFVLPSHPGMVSLFLCAPMDFRIQRVMHFYGAKTPAEARAMIDRSDEVRTMFITQMTGKSWINACNYHLSIDTSSFPMPEVADYVAGFVRKRVAMLKEG
jgi:cytidylate kinase